MAKTAQKAKIRLTENQNKVIKDKYLRDAPSVEAWLLGVARNVALAEVLAHPKAEAWGVFTGVSHRVIAVPAAGGAPAGRVILYHQGLPDNEARQKNFDLLMDNLEKACAKHPEAKALREAWAAKFYDLMARWDFLPNSPTLMNAGRELQQLSACYVLPVPDSMEGITKSLAAQSMIQKSGGGTGFSFSRLRPNGDLVKKTQGVASGALSFMKLFDTMTDVVKQGGTRRGANMAILRYDHPEIMDFIRMKTQPGVMENFNVSVGVDAAFMRAVLADAEYDLINPRTGKPAGKLRAKEVFDAMVELAWKTGDPGYVVLDRINASGSNTTPALGQIESTNPCFAGHVRLATDRGLLTFEELYLDKTALSVATDNRVPSLQSTSVGSVAAKTVMKPGITMRPAVPVFKTRKNWPVFRLETTHGYEVVATKDHRFFTPTGPKALSELKPGDPILLQSGAGTWSSNHALPPFFPKNQLKARIDRGEARLPTAWSREVGEFLGWISGDGWVSSHKPKGREIPNHTVGLMFGSEEKKFLAPKFKALIKEWTGLTGAGVERNGTLSLYYKSSLYYLLRSFGACADDGLRKEVPESLWSAPREAVVGYLSALFTADGTVNIAKTKQRCSIRLANSSKKLLQQVQLLLLNEGIVSRLYLRRAGGDKLMPDSRRQPKKYAFSDQYELIITKTGRRLFLERIGFLLSSKQAKAVSWERKMSRGAYKETFVTRVATISPAGSCDVYCTTEPETHSLVAGGIVSANCGEQPLLPWEPCNLGSLNLSAFVTGETGAGRWDFPRLKETVATAIRFLEDVIEVNNYPLPEIEALAKGNRRIGLGVMGWAEALVKTATAYADPEACKLGDKVMSFINGAALEASEKIALERGVFPNWKDSVYDPDSTHFRGQKRLPRHCARTTIAPTGTIAIAAGLQGGGIEPFFAIAYTRYNAKALEMLKAGKQPADKDVFFEVNPLFKDLAEKNDWFGLGEKTLLRRVDENHKSLKGIPEIPDRIQRLFATAHDISTETHVRMQAAFQQHTDNGVSKTINLPETATVDDVRGAYLLSYELGCKGITVYRDGSKAQQVLNISSAASKTKRRTPEASLGLDAEYYQIRTGYGPLHVHVNYDEQGPFQLFANIPPLGTEIAGLTSLVGILISKYLSEGGDPLRLLKHLNSVKGDRPVGLGPSRVDSIPHAIAIALRAHLKKTGWIESVEAEEAHPTTTPAEHCPKCFSRNVSHESGCSGPTCHDCGHSECS
jgi:ribonucleoside-diphosphate reductase alpha chain